MTHSRFRKPGPVKQRFPEFARFLKPGKQRVPDAVLPIHPERGFRKRFQNWPNPFSLRQCQEGLCLHDAPGNQLGRGAQKLWLVPALQKQNAADQFFVGELLF